MSEAEKQEGQKTVVAFITGLLIGGLLVWVFSSSPEAQAPAATETEESSVTTPNTPVGGTTDVQVPPVAETVTGVPQPVTGAGVLSAVNQKAGKTVSALVTSYPAQDGWVVVRDYTNGSAGKILGAARYSVSEGLFPSSIELMRDTVKGSEYQVSFYSENGDKKFATKDDVYVAGGEAVFTAE